MKRCEYCELELPHVEMEAHEDYCGSRTECCPKCKRYIQIRDHDQHEITDCAYPEQKPPTHQTSSRGALFDMDDGLDETTLHAITNRFMFPQYVDASSLLVDSSSTRTSRNVNLNSALGINPDTEGSRQANGESRSRRQRKNQDRVQNIYKNTNQRKPVASKKKGMYHVESLRHVQSSANLFIHMIYIWKKLAHNIQIIANGRSCDGTRFA